MVRLCRFLAVIAVLLGTLPCELRDALPVVGELVATCCVQGEEAAGDELSGDELSGAAPADCCDTDACGCALPVVTGLAGPTFLGLADGFLMLDPAAPAQRPRWQAGPPPTPPPIG